MVRELERQGIAVPCATLHRFAVKELDFGDKAPTIPVDDCAPAAELQLDTGWMTLLEPDVLGRRRRFRAWIFTSVYSRHRFVYPCFEETTKSAIEACEAAWAFFGGVFHVLIPANTKTIVNTSAPTKEALAPKPRRPRLDWAQLHQRTFGTDVLRCPCGGRRTIKSLHFTRKQAEARLAQLGVALPSRVLPPATDLTLRGARGKSG